MCIQLLVISNLVAASWLVFWCLALLQTAMSVAISTFIEVAQDYQGMIKQ